jgi:mannose-1-phosphate guanylyltransferase/mannose-6-phosphate isomerase
MEKSDRIAVVPTAPGWCDVGAWSALWEIGGKDESGNVVSGDAIVRKSRDSYVLARSGRLVAVSGLDDVVVVDTDDALLVTRRDEAQGVKGIVAELIARGRPEAVTPKRVERPWGSYRSITLAPGYQVKHITVDPGGRLSLQFHYHRSEHWTVVAGTARVTIGDSVRMLKPNESAFVPLGTVHRLENPGRVPVHLIEVQCGDYLGEDDIVRVEDVYGRARAG